MSQSGDDQWIEQVRKRFAALRTKKPATKAGQIRAVWPEIKAALDSGQSLKTIRDWLEIEGVCVTARSLSVYLARIRQNQPVPHSMRPPILTGPQPEAQPNRETR